MTVHAAGREFTRRSKREPTSCQSWQVVVIPFHPDRGRFFAQCYNAAMKRAVNVMFLIAGLVLVLVGSAFLVATHDPRDNILAWLTNDPLATAAVLVGSIAIGAELRRLRAR